MTRQTDIIKKLIRNRRSINIFDQEREVPVGIIREAIDVAVWAPNHRMTEPWRFYLVGQETKRKICELNADIVTAAKGEAAGKIKLDKWMKVPGWLVVTCQKSDDPVMQQEDYAACACVIHNLSLILWSQGIGMKWTTGEVTRDDRFYDLVWIDRDAETVVGLMWYGYPDESPAGNRRPGQELTVELP
ncbi:MAG: nitroreductase [Gammaproteobacteria bacterium]|nr:nitroreductase [Gammaproteobacteria bacterium]